MNTLAQSLAADRLYGPDLATLPRWVDQLTCLELARGIDLDTYVETWLAVSDQNGGGATAFWDRTAGATDPAELLSGYGCDRQEAERRERHEALHDHWQDVEGFRPAMQRELMRLGRFIDNRRAPLIEIKAVVRAFLATGGRLLIAPEGSRRRRDPIEVSPDVNRYARGPWSEIDGVAAAAMFRLAQRWRAQPKLARIIRTLGTAENGWFVLTGDRS